MCTTNKNDCVCAEEQAPPIAPHSPDVPGAMTWKIPDNDWVKRMVSILIVDDFEEWRSEIRSILQVNPEWKIVAEACDGADAVQKATELQPNIILLDIGLPTLNGIDAAKIIRQRCPESRIIFLTMNKDREIMSEAHGMDHARYILKTNAATELLDAIEASST